jgi:predicted RNase H-like HicB family nuclease
LQRDDDRKTDDKTMIDHKDDTDYMNYTIDTAVEIQPDGQECHGAWVVECPGCRAQGDTQDEALSRLTAIIPSYMKFRRQHGLSD